MHINPISNSEHQVKQTLAKMQHYLYNPRQNKLPTRAEDLAHDLFSIGEQCKTNQLKDFMNTTLINIAKQMQSFEQNNFAGIIYSFLIKANQDNTSLLKTLELNALDVAIKQSDSVHIAARAGELANTFKNEDNEKHLKYLNINKDALKDICENYNEMDKRYKTISRPLKPIETYVLTLIKNEIAIAESDPKECNKKLLAIYKMISNTDELYGIQNTKELDELRGYISAKITNLLFHSNCENLEKKFANTRKKILEAMQYKDVLTRDIIIQNLSQMYDEFANNSIEMKFTAKALALIEDLRKNGEYTTAGRIYTLLLEKNKNNLENKKTIAKHGFQQTIKDKDDFGVVYFGNILQKTLKESKDFAPNKCLEVLDITMKACKNIVDNYEVRSKNEFLRPKNDYIKDLIFNKVSASNLMKRSKPDVARTLLLEAKSLINELPQSYLSKNQALQKEKTYINSLLSKNFN